MATQPLPSERRRAERVLIRVPLLLRTPGRSSGPYEQEAEAVVVSRYGALLRAPAPVAPGSTIELTHGFTKEKEKFRVIWSGAARSEGRHDLGVELVTQRDDFWGIRFPPRDR